MGDRVEAQYRALRANFRRIERREWWLWASAFVITLLLTIAVASFLLPGAYFHQDFTSQHVMSQAMRGLVALVFLFDLYTIYQHLLIHRIRRELVQREELFQRVCRYSLEIPRAMGWQERQLMSLARGAYLHDIGKLGVPDAILLKPGQLTAEERKIMQCHAQIGFDLVKDIPFLADASEVVLRHHERFDGSGYPQGLKGEAIQLSARIFAIADTLDAITSERPYQRASSFESAREIIRRLSGTAFDPQVVNVFLKIRDGVCPLSPRIKAASRAHAGAREKPSQGSA